MFLGFVFMFLVLEVLSSVLFFCQISSVFVWIMVLFFYFVLFSFFLLISLQEIMPLEEVFQTLRCDSNGLTIASAERYLVSLIMF